MMQLIGKGLKLVSMLLEHGTPEAVDAAKSLVKKLVSGSDGELTEAEVNTFQTSWDEAIAANDVEVIIALHQKWSV